MTLGRSITANFKGYINIKSDNDITICTKVVGSPRVSIKIENRKLFVISFHIQVIAFLDSANVVIAFIFFTNRLSSTAWVFLIRKMHLCTVVIIFFIRWIRLRLCNIIRLFWRFFFSRWQKLFWSLNYAPPWQFPKFWFSVDSTV